MSLLGIDIGTSGCKAVLFREQGGILHHAYRKYPVLRPEPGAAELDVIETERAVMEVIQECASHSSEDMPKALAVSSFGECCIPIASDGQALCRYCILPEDSRPENTLDLFCCRFSAQRIQQRTGVYPASFYSLPLLSKQFRNTKELKDRCSMVLDWSGYIAFRLCGTAAFNTSSASRTMGFDVSSMQWIPEYLEFFGLDVKSFPVPAAPGTALGTIRRELAESLGLPSQMTVVAGTHDQCAAAIGCGAVRPSDMMLGMGSYACAVFCRKNGTPPPEAYGCVLNREPHAVSGHFASFLFHGSCGLLLEWAADNLFSEYTGNDRFERILSLIPDWGLCPAPAVIPEFGRCKGIIGELGFGDDRISILKGICNGIFFYFRDCVRREKHSLRQILITGKTGTSSSLLQLASDILELPVRRNGTPEAGALGSALLAGIGCGIYPSVEEAWEMLPHSEVRRFRRPCHARLRRGYLHGGVRLLHG